MNHIIIDIGQLIENTCHLNTKKLCEMYNKSVELEFNVKESYFREVINTNFNFGFGSPKTDDQLKVEKDMNKKQVLETHKQVHKLKVMLFMKC